MNNLMINLVSISSALVISVFVKKIYNYYNIDLNDKYIIDSMRSE